MFGIRNADNLTHQIREDWDVNGRDWTTPGFRALAAHRFATWVRRDLGPGILKSVLWYLDRTIHRFVRNHYGIEIPPGAIVGRRVVIVHQGGTVIHGCAVIGDDCIIRQNATIGALGGDRPLEAPRLGRGVQVGAGAVILGPVTIGDGARIGPNAVVMTDVPAGATVFVNPPRMMLDMRSRGNDADAREPRAVAGAQ